MNLDKAIQNIDIVLRETRMTRQEHFELDSNLKFLVGRARLADELEDKLAGNAELSDKLEQEVETLKYHLKQYDDVKKDIKTPVDPPRPKNGIKEVA